MTVALREHWTLDEDVAFLNHGSFGATPRSVLVAQARLRERLEREPVAFFERFLPDALAAARGEVAAWIGADPEGLAFVPNASTGVATVLANLALSPGDELLVTDHAYGACHNAFAHTAARAGACPAKGEAGSGARLVVASIPFCGATADGIVAAIARALTPRTRLVLLDHVTSPSGLVMPLERLLPLLAERGIDVLVDGAHAPGMLELDLDALARAGMTYYTGNGHKWPCAPKGTAFLWVRADRRDGFHPLVISHGLTMPLPPGLSRFRAEHDWTGTDDPSAHLAFPIAIAHLAELMPGGWPAIRARNRALTLAMRAALCDALAIAPPCDDALVAGLAAIPLPADARPDLTAKALHDRLFEHHKVEVPVYEFQGTRILRVAPHLHTDHSDLERLITALRVEGLVGRHRAEPGAHELG